MRPSPFMLLNYNHLYYFHLAAIEGSVAGAAQRLGVTQPTVSEQLRTLEQVLGATLFERTPNGLRLTEVGRLAFLHTTKFFGASDRLSQAVMPESKTASTVRLGLSSALPRSTTNEWLLLLLSRRDLITTARSADCVELIRALRSGLLDLVLCEIEPTPDMCRGLATRIVTRVRFVAIAPPGVTMAADWSDIGIVQFRPTSPYRWAISDFLDAQGLRPRLVGESDDALFIVDAAIHGKHVAIVPESAARPALADGRVTQIDLADLPALVIHALYQDNTMALSAIDSLVANHEQHAEL